MTNSPKTSDFGPARPVGVTLGRESIPVSALVREGAGEPIVYLHGLGCSKEDFLGAAAADGLPGHHLLALDFPGCGDTPYPEGGSLTMDHLVEVTRLVLYSQGLEKVSLVGHSMGGLVALLLAVRHPELVRRLVNVEGNLGPEDCFFSRQVAALEYPEFEAGFLERFEAWLVETGRPGYEPYAAQLRQLVTSRAFYDYAHAIVRHSDHDPLLAWFVELPLPRLFVYGAENRGLSYIPTLASTGVPLHEVPESNHFPVWSNPTDYYAAIRGFLEET